MTLNRFFPREALLFVTAMWVVFFIDLLLPGIYLNRFGIQPRRLDGLTGIFLSPFLHGGFSHIISNTIPLLLLAAFVCLSVGSRKMVMVMFAGIIGSGLGTWLFSSGHLVIGASGLVFSLIGFLLADAWFSPSMRSWTVAILSFVFCGGILWSLFVYLPYISWAAHFWGFISGIVIALWLRSPRKSRSYSRKHKTVHHPLKGSKGRKT